MWPLIKDDKINIDISLYKTKEVANVKAFFLAELNDSFKDISKAYNILNQELSKGKDIPVGSQWILDNFYYVEQKYRDLRDSFKKSKKIVVDVIDNGLFKGLPRAYILALNNISNINGNITEEGLIDFINIIQKEETLTLEEIYHLPNFLSLGLIQHIRKVLLDILEVYEKWKKIESIDISSEEALENIIANIHTMSSTEIERLRRKVKIEKTSSKDILEKIDKKLDYLGSSARELLEKEYRNLSQYKLYLGYGITSLRTIYDLNWENIFNNISLVEKTIRQDPLNIYDNMDYDSKNYYRHRIQELAYKFHLQEIYLAKKIVEFAKEEFDKGIRDKKSHIGYYLFDEGIERLYRDFGSPKDSIEKYNMDRIRYFFSIIFLALLLSFLFSYFSYTEGNHIIFVLALIPAATISTNIINKLYTKRHRPKLIPKLEFQYNIPKELSTFVVVPCLLPNKSRVEELAKSLETYYLSNKDENIYFGILGDFKDGEDRYTDEDEKIISKGLEVIRELNNKYPSDKDRFYYFHRDRNFSDTQRKWMGWERKRGALVEFNRLLLGEDTTFNIISKDVSNLDIKYIITLDGDTELPINAAKKLIGTIAHPLNQAVLDDRGKIVKSGYGIIQPRIIVDTESTNKSLFTRIFAGEGGIDPYSGAISDIYQDLFQEGIFTGKGIYDLRVFHEVLENSIPENSILSHDLLEGSYIRVGLATDIFLIDGYPEKYNSYIMRQHRWVRGDWQLIKWLYGQRGKEISLLSRWKILDNMRRSLIPTSLLLLVFSIAFFSINPYVWTIFSLFIFFHQFIFMGINNIFHNGFKNQNIKLHGDIIRGCRVFLYQGFLSILFLPYEGVMMLDAIIRSIYRVFVSRKNLLEWTTAFDMEKNLGNSLSGYFKKMKSNIIAALLLVGLTYIFNYENLGLSLILGILWFSGPMIASYISKEDIDERVMSKKDDIELLHSIGKKTWDYYREITDKKNNYLPPDNYQEFPYNGVANRTSPTNIGFYLLSILSSRDLGYIDTEEMFHLVDLTIATIEKLEKWEGHLYNWYDTETLEPLRPIFVSTVDSGNLLGYLIVLKEGLKEYLHESNLEENNLINRIEKLIYDTNMKTLYDKDKELFYIGYNVDENKVLNVYYDLLASEARTTSYIAISRGEVPPEHWHKLGKPLVKEKGYISLVSWTGTMFEYLMPALTMKSYKNTLLDETYKTCINIQRDYGNYRKVPWGISESGYFAFDSQFNYQYKAFGVPKLGFKRGLKEELVISPYSTFLALNFDYPNSMENIKRMRLEGLEGKYGFYESVDYTLNRLPKHLNRGIVKSYMSHHQGMIFVSINNFINNNIMIKRFHKDSYMKCGEYLLQERTPNKFYLSNEYETPHEFTFYKNRETLWNNRLYGIEDLWDIKCHILSSRTYTMMINSMGEGFSKNKDIFLNRWRRDFLSNSYGQFIYIKDVKNNKLWSTTYAPTFVNPDDYNVSFSTDKASFNRKDGDIESTMEVFLLPEELGEVRKIVLKNHGTEEALLETISYFEVTGTTYHSDLAHMAFNNLFVKTEILEKEGGLLAHRRKREKKSGASFIFHVIRAFGQEDNIINYETNKSNFIGRGNSLKMPQAIEKGNTNSTGIVLDPIMSISKKISIPPKEKVEVYYITGLAHSRDEVSDILNKYSTIENINMAMDLISTKSQTEVGYLNLDHSNIGFYEELLPYLFYLKHNKKEKYKNIISAANKGKEGLWAHGISGDNPIVLINIKSMEGLDNLVKTIHAHEYWSYKGVIVDLVILYEEEDIYYSPLKRKIIEIIHEIRGNIINIHGGIYVKNTNTLEKDEEGLFYKWANLIINGEEEFNFNESNRYKEIKIKKSKGISIEDNISNQDLELEFFNGYGGFSNDGKEYIIKLQKNLNTPMPWINVVANKDFGFIVTEGGTGFTWSINSRENKLTPWYNDPINDIPSEIIYLKDNDTGEIFTITPKPIRGEEEYLITYGKGYAVFNHNSHGIEQSLTMFVPIDDKIKISLINLKNTTKKTRNLTLVYYIRPVLGVTDEETQSLIKTSMESEDIFKIKNSSNTEFKNSTIFIASSEKIKSYTGDRLEFLGNIPDYENPRGVNLDNLSNSVGIGYNPCGAIEIEIVIPPGEEKELVFLLGEERDLEKGYKTINKYKDLKESKMALENIKEFWNRTIDTIQVFTKDESLNYMMNSWLIYQTICSRIWARAGFYQVGGAYGGRDQIQDVSNILYHRPEEARRQIIENCAHQYIEGDIQHWWHPLYDNEVNKGIRSKCSDDLLWLPYCVGEYISITGDYSILDEEVYYIESEPLGETEYERYEVPIKSKEKGTVYGHCIRAIERGINLSEKNLPLMGTGDWNDGMNKVGHKGKGESIWLGWFLATVLQKFIPICERQRDILYVEKYKDQILNLKEAIENNGWDGEWYIRAFFDDGSPIGSKSSKECSIDSISQSWSVISKLGDKERAKSGLKAVEKYLVNEEEGIIALLTPPFENIELDPGYIKSYVSGVRENGGQYTHAATWVIKAFAMLGEGDKAYNLFKLINPINHTRTQIECAKYKVEPYVVTADIYTNPEHLGRGGWSWYTGSSGWMYKVVLEDILGFRKEGDKLFINPSIPKDWDEYRIRYSYGDSIYNIEIKNPKGVNTGVSRISVDGSIIKDDHIKLIDDGSIHKVLVKMG